MAAIIMKVLQTQLSSPIGNIIIQANDEGISYVGFYPPKNYPEFPLTQIKNKHVLTCVKQLSEYFVGTRQVFSITLATQGTPFQHAVWQALLSVPFGITKTYGDIATSLSNPKAVRAVGAANGKNPISIIVPCHRIIGADGKLTGYAGGLERKHWLLEHEGII
ncbi:methylated-DNA--[protein]-cysteine S-methyltransferase [Pseudoalteromonas sp. AOP31-A2-14]|uniref:methylated-DNA--[protein]-cysteine S-methyltransferase n=2 Tax=Pseudoalteromonas TaxID=53246 RepID=UPI003FB7D3F4